MEEGKLKVMLVRPMRKPVMIEIDDSLEAMQKVVGGPIEEYAPFDDDVSIICNEEGLLLGLPLNRATEFDELGLVRNAVAGDFFLCNAPAWSEKFLSLTKEQEIKYMEVFFKSSAGIHAEKIIRAPKVYER